MPFSVVTIDSEVVIRVEVLTVEVLLGAKEATREGWMIESLHLKGDNLAKVIKSLPFYSALVLNHPSLPGHLFSPQQYLHSQNLNPDDHFRVYDSHTEWHTNGQRLFTMEFDECFLPRITLFHPGKATSTLLALQSVAHHSNHWRYG